MRQAARFLALGLIAAAFASPANAQIFGGRQVVVTGPTYQRVVVAPVGAVSSAPVIVEPITTRYVQPTTTYVRTSTPILGDPVVRTVYTPTTVVTPTRVVAPAPVVVPAGAVYYRPGLLDRVFGPRYVMPGRVVYAY